MTTPPNNPLPAPGWYPDPSGAGQLRWWDGNTWTPHMAATMGLGPLIRPRIDANAPIYNPLIWLIVLLPLVPLVLLLAWNPDFRYRSIGSEQIRTLDPFSLMTPIYLLAIVSSWLVFGISVWLAYLDWRMLGRIGVVRPFHWAWAFLGAAVYTIGRSVIVYRVGNPRGLAPIWALVGVTVVSFVLWGIKMFSISRQMMDSLPTY